MLKRIPIDLSSLWINPENQFTVRFLDLNEFRKAKLADRIKKVAPQSRIRSEKGPNLQDIYCVLEEINPIIFQEGRDYFNQHIDTQTPKYQKRKWNRTRTIGLDGYIFTNLCQAIYEILCTKPRYDHNINLIQNICHLATGNSDQNGNIISIDGILNQLLHQEDDSLLSHDPKLNTDAVGMEEIGNARKRVERNQNQTAQINHNSRARVGGIDFALRDNPFPITGSNREARRRSLQINYESYPRRNEFEDIEDYLARMQNEGYQNPGLPGEEYQEMLQRLENNVLWQ